MTCGIYGIKNKINNKMYIGQSINIDKRQKIHKSLLKNNKHFNRHLQNSYNKRGKEEFEYLVLEECDRNKLSIKEEEWILKYKNSIYNKNLEVNAVYQGKRHTDEIKEKMRLAKVGLYDGIKNPNYGNKWTEQQKLKNSLNHPRTKLNESDVLRIKGLLLAGSLNDKEIAEQYNVNRTVITRISNGARWASITGGPIIFTERRGLRNIGKPRSEETKTKIKNAITGIKRSEETKEKISKAKLKKGN